MEHAYTPKAIRRAVEAGVRTIEHGNLIDEPTAQLLKQSGVFVTPTLITYDMLSSEGPALGLPAESIVKIDDGGSRAAETAIAAVLIALGAVPDEGAAAGLARAPVLNTRGVQVGERRAIAMLRRSS